MPVSFRFMGLYRSSIVILVGVVLVSCGSPTTGSLTSGLGTTCFPDSDGINGGMYTFDLIVNDTGFYNGAPDSGPVAADAGMQVVLASQNDATITLTLTNQGTVPHGFEVDCTSVVPSYPDLPAGCPSMACFPSGSTIAPIAPGTSTTVTFDTPTPDGLLYPFKSSAPGDSAVPGLNGMDGTAWSLM